MAKRTTARGPWLMWIGLVGFISFAVLAYCTLMFGLVQGEEFSPNTFVRREFQYYQLPWLGWQISPISRQTKTNALETYVAAQSWVSPLPAGSSQRWDLVLATQGTVPGTQRILSQGGARILCAYLDAQRENQDLVWLEWSKKNPELAKVVWPLIVRLARDDLYVFVPDLLRVARGESDVEKLRSELQRRLAERYLEFAQVQQRIGRHEAAVELFSGAIDYAPESPVAFQGRADSLAKLGQSDRASADLAQARKFQDR